MCKLYNRRINACLIRSQCFLICIKRGGLAEEERMCVKGREREKVHVREKAREKE